jgi:hypothetical protein
MTRLSAAEREALIARYAAGPERLRAALARCPEEMRRWRPDPEAFSVHEVVCHCADSETVAAARIRILTAEPEPLILGYDEQRWARVHDYHAHPLAAALLAVEAARAHTVPLLLRLPEAAWELGGRHTESGPYTARDWLAIYARHLEEHSEQIESVLAAWNAAGAPVGERS